MGGGSWTRSVFIKAIIIIIIVVVAVVVVVIIIVVIIIIIIIIRVRVLLLVAPVNSVRVDNNLLSNVSQSLAQ